MKRTTTLLAVIFFCQIFSFAQSPESAPPYFSMSFSPSSVGPSSSSLLTYTIDNSEGAAITDIAFTNNLPAGVTIASPSGLIFNEVDGTVTAPDGGNTISFTGGKLGAGSSLTIQLYVTSSTAGTHINTTGDLTSSAGNSGTASNNLVINGSNTGLSSAFSDASINVGQKSTLTFTFDNTLNGSNAGSGFFSTNLPDYLVWANPVNLTNTCPKHPLVPVTANPGERGLSFSFNSAVAYVPAGSTCAISLDVEALSIGSELLVSTLSGNNMNGIAISKLQVIPNASGGILFDKAFSSEVISPGENAQLTYTIKNLDRANDLTALTFTDDLGSVIPGLVATGLPISNSCGSGSTISGTNVITLTGGNIPPEGTCSFSVPVSFPSNAPSGNHTSESSVITGTRGGNPVTGPTAKKSFYVYGKPILTKVILNKPVDINGTTTFRYTIENTDLTNTLSNITFVDDANGQVGNMSFTFPPAGFCGAGSGMSFYSPVSEIEGVQLTGGELAPGASCTFDLGVDLQPAILGGEYLGIISNAKGEFNSYQVNAETTNDTLKVSPVPHLSKAFSSSGLPGDTLTIEYLFTLDALATQTFSGLSFTDDFSSMTSGTGSTSLLITEIQSVCGGASATGMNTNIFSLNGASLSPGDTCRISVKVKIPEDSDMGSFTSVTSPPTDGSFTGTAATADFDVIGLIVKKEYSQPSFPGDVMQMTYSFINPHPTYDVNLFTPMKDGLDNELTGLSYSGGNLSNFCGSSSSLTGTNLLSFSGIEVSPADTCKLTLEVNIPANAAINEYQTTITKPTSLFQNSNSNFANGNSFKVENSTFKISNAIAFSKAFLSNAEPGDTVSLAFTIKNLHPSETLTGISFTDNLSAMYAGFTSVDLPQADILGTGSSLSTASGGDSIIVLSGGSLLPNQEITFNVKVKVPEDIYSGDFDNTTSLISFDLNSNNLTYKGAVASLTINNNRRPTFSKAFAQDTILTGQTTRLTFTIDNSLNGDPINTFSFSDNFPEGMLIASTPNIVNSCNVGTVTGTAGASSFSVSGGSVAALSSCTFSVDVKASKSSINFNTSEDLISNAGTSGKAKDSIYVKMPEPSLFTVSTLSHNAISLSASPNVNNGDSILVAFSGDGVFGVPTGFLSSGASISGGGEVLFKGLAANLPNHTGLDQATVFFYKVWSLGYDLYSDIGLTGHDTTCIDTAQLFTIVPSESTVCVGSNLKLTAAPVLENVSYTWQVKPQNGTFSNISPSSLYSKEDSSTLLISSVSLAENSNTYRCIISSKCDTDTTSEYNLAVFGNPVITLNPKDSSNCAGSDFKFYVAATGPNLTYQWQKRVGTSAFVDVASADDDTLTLNAVPFSEDSTFYRCVITGTCGVSISDSALLRAPLIPTITAGTAVNPSTCLGVDGSIPFTSTNLPAGTYSLSFTGAGSPKNVAVANDTFSLRGLTAGNYSGFSVTHLACTGSDASSKTLSDPPTPTILAGTAVNPSTCLGVDGSIPFTSTNLPAGIYSLSFTGAGSPKNVEVANDTFSLRGLAAGTYSGFSVTHLACTGSDASSKTLSDPPTPTILAGTAVNPSTCLGTDGSIPFTCTNLPAGTYSLSFTGAGSPKNVEVANDTFSLRGLTAGTYSGFSVTHLACTGSDASSKTLSDPPTPTILAGTAVNPSTCLGTDGSIPFTCTNLPAGTYSLSFTGAGSPKNVEVANDTFSLRGLTAGTYSGFSVTHLACTGSDASSKTLSDPPTPTITAGTAVNPSTCLGVDGSIPFTSTNLPAGTYSLSFTGAGSPKNVAVANDTFSLRGLTAGNYSGFSVTHLACTGSDASSKTLSDPLTPTITAGTAVNPSTCLGVDGSIPFTSTNLPAGTYSLSFTGAGSPKNVSVANDTFSLRGLAAGTYSSFSVTHLACTGSDASSKTLSDPPTPTITAGTAVNPSTCLGVDGSIPFTSTNLPAGTYSLSFTGAGSPKNVEVANDTFSLRGLTAGSYSGFSVTHLACTGSDASSKTLSDPPTPTITAGTAVNPSTCLGVDGSIPFTSTNLPAGTYSLSFTGVGSPKNVSVANDTFSLRELAAGTYSGFSVTHLACTGSDASSKTLSDPPTPTITAGTAVNPSTCLGVDGSIPFTSTNLPAGTYSLSFTGAGSPKNVSVANDTFSLRGLTAGSYSGFSVTHLACTGSDASSKTLSDPTYSVSASNLGPYEEGGVVELFASNGVSFDWSGPNGFTSSLQSPSISNVTISDAGIYSVTVLGENNCSVEVTTQVDVACSTPSMSYYLAYAGSNPELISPLIDGMEVQQSTRRMTVIAYSTCTVPKIESVKLQLSGTSNLQYYIDNEMPFNLHELGNVSNGDILPNNGYTFIGRGYSEDNAEGQLLVGDDVLQFDIVPPIPSTGTPRAVAEPTSSNTDICIGNSFNVSTSSTGSFIVGNLYQVYLSNADGLFSSRTLIGSSTNPSQITCTIPNFIKGGTKYKIMVVTTAPIVSSAISAGTLSIIGADLVLSSPMDDVAAGVKTYKAINNIKAGNKIEAGGNATLNSSRKIELEPGFKADAGSVFKAELKSLCPN
ncbi:3-coathanger stack domain-containing protein [uncultured Arcticibacterium sp.]|uniref:DUF7933 domain-containing protein n=1 Tax=uncultured Arcticibacterium sp. TaxID=2173042 RepID=UPI0030F8B496